MAESYRERMARRQREADAANERDPEKLKKWYELAAEGAPDLDIKPEDPDKAIQESSRIIASAAKPKAPKPKGGGGGFDETIEAPEAGTAIGIEGDRHYRPIYNKRLGRAGHRRVYAVTEATRAAQEQGRSTPTEEEIEQHGRSWDIMPDDSKHFWQNTPHGAKATADAIAALDAPTKVQTQGNARFNASYNRHKIVEAAFDSSESAKAFQTSGVLNDEDGNPERDWNKPWRLVNATSQQQRKVSSRSDILGRALHTDPQHHQALSDHIDDLVSRSNSSAPAHLQGNQFNVKEGYANAAKEALARSAMAHALGMKDAAISHFKQAVTHAGDLAVAVHGVNSQPIADWDKEEDIQSKYIKSVNEAK